MKKYIILDEHAWCWTRERGMGFWVRDRHRAVKYLKLSALFWVMLMRNEGVEARVWEAKE